MTFDLWLIRTSEAKPARIIEIINWLDLQQPE